MHQAEFVWDLPTPDVNHKYNLTIWAGPALGTGSQVVRAYIKVTPVELPYCHRTGALSPAGLVLSFFINPIGASVCLR